MKTFGPTTPREPRSRISPVVVMSVVGVVLPLLVALSLDPFRSNFDATDDALVLVVIVIAIATFGRRVAGVLCALSASTWFDFFYTRPFHHFTINKESDIETTVLLLVVGVIATELAAHARRHRHIAQEGANHLALVHDFSEMVVSGEPTKFVVIRAAAEISDLLSLRDCRFDNERGNKSCPRLEPGGEVIVAGKRWLANDIGLPNPEVELVIEMQGKFLGRFVMAPSTGKPVTLEKRLVAVAIAGQVGAALANENRPN